MVGRLMFSPWLRAMVAVLALAPCLAAHAATATLQAPKVVLTHIPFSVTANAVADGTVPQLRVGDEVVAMQHQPDGSWKADALSIADRDATLTLLDGNQALASTGMNVLPGWLSLTPPVVAIALAFITRSVIPSLFFGIWMGAWLVAGPGLKTVFSSLLASFSTYTLGAAITADHMAIMLFTFMIGGMVGIISRNGGMNGIVNRILGWAHDARRGQAAIASLGMFVFFDDYANTLVVGNTSRPVADKLRISREKLAYLVDSTAAPVATVAVVTTWIGFQVGVIDQALAITPQISESAYGIFLNSIPYSFYPLLAIAFVYMVALSGRDFGPMLSAERRVRNAGRDHTRAIGHVHNDADDSKALEPDEGIECRAINAVLPVIVLVLGVIGGILHTGEGDTIQDILGSANSYDALMWASLLAVLTAAVLSLVQGLLSMEEVVQAWYLGVRYMLLGLIVLVLAWALADVTGVLNTANYLVSLLGDSVSPGWVPILVFLISGAVAFATGSSWGAMGILMPLVLPLTAAVLSAEGTLDAERMYVLYTTVACVLAGAVWADHCSPISDTTVLTSLATGCDHMDHVRTQMPYALVVGGVSMLLGVLPSGFGFPWWLSLVGGAGALWFVLRFKGQHV